MLTEQSFSAYPPEARRVAIANLDVLRRLPLALTPLLLKELNAYDWKFPAERRDLDRQFSWLRSLNGDRFNSAVAEFAKLKLTPELERFDWVNSPAGFSEQLTAHLWTTHQIDGFRAAAVEYVAQSSAFNPDPPPTTRLGIAIIGKGVASTQYRLFRKLRPKGTWYSAIEHSDGLNTIVQEVVSRSLRNPQPYAHWYIDGAAAHAPDLTVVSYATLAATRTALQAGMQKTYEAAKFDPEAFRSMLARTKPEDVGLAASGDPILNRFSLSLLSEGSGTQVFATTFVQWAAREALRRAQPLTLIARFTPRQREKPMNELLAEAQRKPELDAEGSLIDADMGAYYTWLNQQRLPGAANFLVWFEDRSEAVAISAAHKPGAESSSPIELRDLVSQLA